MTGTELITRNFNYNGKPFTLITGKDDEPWFIAKEVCDFLELSNPSKMVSVLDDSEKAAITISYTSSSGVVQNRKVKIINRSGFFAIAFRSRKPEAVKFRIWVTSEVLTQIDDTGVYIPKTNPGQGVTSNSQMMSNVETMAEALLEFEQTLVKMGGALTLARNVIAVKDQVIEDQGMQIVQANAQIIQASTDLNRAHSTIKTTLPKSKKYDEFINSNSLISLRDFGKIYVSQEHVKLYLGVNKFQIGPNKITYFLRARKVLYGKNKPYQKWIDAGYFEVKPVTSQGFPQTFFTPSGVSTFCGIQPDEILSEWTTRNKLRIPR